MTRQTAVALLGCVIGCLSAAPGAALPESWTLDRLMTPAEVQATGVSGSTNDMVCAWVYDYAFEVFDAVRSGYFDRESLNYWTRPFQRDFRSDEGNRDPVQVFEEEELADLTEARRRAFYDWLERFVGDVAREAKLPHHPADGDRTVRTVRQSGWTITLEDGSTWEVLSWYRTVTSKWEPGMRVSLEESPISFGEFHQMLVATTGERALVRPDQPIEGQPPVPDGQHPPIR